MTVDSTSQKKVAGEHESPAPRKPELLAPAGGLEQLEYALHFGADAVYVGGENFGLRKRAINFTTDELAAAVAYTHSLGKRIFVTVNALVHDNELESLRSYLEFLGEVGVDAVIVSDLATIRLAREVAPNVAIHVSTQASCTNSLSATQYFELGAQRIVLARELSLAEIIAIRAAVPRELELEVFVHGAMCMAHSGRCLISNFLTGRDANRGHCTQPCRWRYALVEETRPGQFFPVVEEESSAGSFIMSSKDLCMIEHLDELAAAGIDSIKIEGRVKGAYYVATVVNAYRQVLDGVSPASVLDELNAVSHRPYSTGFFYGPAEQSYEGAEYTQTHDLIAIVTACDLLDPDALPAGDSLWSISVSQRNRFFEGDQLEVISPGYPVRRVVATNVRTMLGQLCDTANRACETYTFECPFELHAGDLLRRKR